MLTLHSSKDADARSTPAPRPGLEVLVALGGVGRHNAFGLGRDELLPAGAGAIRGWVPSCGVEDAPDRGRRDPIADTAEFSVDTAVYPARVLGPEPQYQSTGLGSGRWPPRWRGSLGPVSCH